MFNSFSNLRDVKSALSAGMLMFFALWLLLGDDVAKVQPGDSLLGRVAILVQYVGPAVTLAAVTFAAYLLGLILPFHHVGLWALGRLNRGRAVRQEDRLFRFILDQVRRAGERESLDELLRRLLREVPAMYEFSFPDPWWIRLAPPRWRPRLRGHRTRWALKYAKRKGSIEIEEPDPADLFARRGAERNTEKHITALLLRRIYSESALLAVDLGYKDDKAYDRFDRARSESEFRVGLCLPLLILTTVVALQFPSRGFVWTDVVVVGSLWTAVVVVRMLWGAGRAFWIIWILVGLFGVLWVVWGRYGVPWEAVGVLSLGCFAALVLASWATSKAQEAQEEVSSAVILGRIRVPELQVLQDVIATPERTWSSKILDALRIGE